MTPIRNKVDALAERELVLARLAWLNEYIADPNPPQPAEPRTVETVDGPVGDVGKPPAQYVGKGGLQPFDIIDAFDLDFYEGNAMKYLLRWRKKNGLEDLRKAAHYIDEVIVRATGPEQAGD